jgi:hypothetical protein
VVFRGETLAGEQPAIVDQEIEGEAGYIKLEGSSFDPLISSTLPLGAARGTPDVLGSAKVGDWYGMITGRLGYAWGRTLIYVKGDAAFVPVRASVLDQGNTPATGCGNWLISTSAGTDTHHYGHAWRWCGEGLRQQLEHQGRVY